MLCKSDIIRKRFPALFAFFALSFVLTAGAPVQQRLFVNGNGYPYFRIPALIVTHRGTLLAFCEGRRGSSDTGNVDLVYRRSTDGGATWSPLKVLADFGDDAIENATPVVDRQTGFVWLLLTANPGSINEAQIMEAKPPGTRTVWVTHSEDDGLTWLPPKEITQTTKRPDWTWYATGPGNGIQLRSGRLLIPCDHTDKGTKMMHSHVIYSDDHGKSWRLGGTAGSQTNESAIAELADGTLVLNMRSYSGQHLRAVSRSHDGGLTWTEPESDPALIEPVCQASLVSYGSNTNVLLFSNPASQKRERLTIRLSEDGGHTWKYARVLYDGPAAYSSLAVLKDGTIGCLYERGRKNENEEITFARFDLNWIKDGKDEPPCCRFDR